LIKDIITGKSCDVMRGEKSRLKKRWVGKRVESRIEQIRVEQDRMEQSE
jgi:hypothetical protein